MFASNAVTVRGGEVSIHSGAADALTAATAVPATPLTSQSSGTNIAFGSILQVFDFAPIVSENRNSLFGTLLWSLVTRSGYRFT